MDHMNKFTGKSSAYTLSRPGYAKGLFEYLVCDLEVNKQTVIADIGSGTGKLSQDLLKVAGIVYCVEPNDEMRQVAESLLSNQEGFISVKGTAEQTTLMDKSVDFILVGQAFHWFDANSFKLECQRILKETGKVILIWNSWIRDSEVIMKYHELFQMFCPSFKGFSGGLESRKICEFFENQYETKRVANHLVFNKESFINRARSASYSLIEGDEKFEDYMEALEKFFEKYAVDGILTMPNETVWYVGEV